MNKKITYVGSRTLIQAAVLVGALDALPVFAQNATLEEVVVTAQKREESLQETPIAITAYSRDALEEMGITSLDGISKVVPNLNLSPSAGYSTNAIINIRGTGQLSNELSRDTSVGVYMDGVPISKTTGSIFDAVDLERIEVLRGPQGTLYGKNTIGGAVNLITVKPTGEFDGKFKVGVGNESLVTTRGSMDSAAIGEVGEGLGQLSARVSGYTRNRDGFYKNDGPSSKDFDNRDQWGWRGALVLDVSENFRAEYNYDKMRLKQNPPMMAIVTGEGASDNDRPSSIANDSAIDGHLDVSGHALTLTYDMDSTMLGDIVFKSITAYRKFDNQANTDFDGTANDMLRFTSDSKYNQTSQEFQFVGTADRVDWVVGTFLYENQWKTDNPRWIFQFGGDDHDVDYRESKEESFALFTQATWRPEKFDEKLAITVGGRYTEDKKKVWRKRVNRAAYNNPELGPCSGAGGVYLRSADGCPILGANGEVQAIRDDDSWSETTPMAIVAWEFNESLNAYAKVTTGFKSGGFNGVAVTEESFRTPFDPETMTTYEVGMKSRWLDSRFQLNGAYFYNDFQDLQADIFVPELLAIAVVNAGDAQMQGVELEMLALPIDNFEVGLNLAWLDTEYNEYIEGGQDVSDDRVFPYSPKYSYNITTKYTFDPFSFGVLSARVDYSWKDDHHVSVTEDPSMDIEAYGLLESRVTLESIPVGNGSMALSLWGKNLTDEEYWDVALDVQVAKVAQWADPRTYGFEVTYEF